MKNSSTVILATLMLLAIMFMAGCADVFHKEWDYAKLNDGNPVLGEKGEPVVFMRSETEYRRIGDQTLTGLTAKKITPDGTEVELGFEQQKSEGKLQIEGLVSAIGEVVASWMGTDGLTPAQIQQLKDLLIKETQ